MEILSLVLDLVHISHVKNAMVIGNIDISSKTAALATLLVGKPYSRARAYVW